MDATFVGLISGAAIGLALALTGAGGVLAVPLLMFGLRMPINEAAPVALIAVGISAGVGAALGLRERVVLFRAAMVMGISGMTVAPLGIWLAQRIPNAPLSIGFAVVLAFTAWRMYGHSVRLRGGVIEGGQPASVAVPRVCHFNHGVGRLDWNASCAFVLVTIGIVSGLLSGLLGVGGGLVIVPALTRFTSIPPFGILATSLSVISLVSLSGVVAASFSGVVMWSIAVPFGLGAVLALLLGRAVAKRLHGDRLVLAFSMVCAIVAGLLLARGCGWID